MGASYMTDGFLIDIGKSFQILSKMNIVDTVSCVAHSRLYGDQEKWQLLAPLCWVRAFFNKTFWDQFFLSGSVTIFKWIFEYFQFIKII